MRSLPPVDVSLLEGARFDCRPDCGLCCYASPLVTPAERPRLVQLEPALSFEEGRGGEAYLRNYGDGGACRALLANRCRVHAARPFPCREFPLNVHLGSRAQVALVLSCPGLVWEASRGPPEGLNAELASVSAELDRVRWTPWVGQQARRWSRKFPGVSPEAPRPPAQPGSTRRFALRAEDFPVPDPPASEEGLDFLPLFHDDEHGQVAFAGHPAGWELLRLRAEGGSAGSLGVFAPPTKPPGLAEGAAEVLQAYLSIVASRDATLWAAALEAEDEDALEAAWEGSVRWAGALALSRASVIRELHGGPGGPLSAAELRAGVRATDAEVLDRPTWGRRL